MHRFYMRTALFVFMIFPILILAACSADEKEDDVLLIKSDERPWLGVQVEDISEKMLKNLNLDHGIRVSKVIKDSPAEKAGLEKDDIILTFDGNDVVDVSDLISMVRKSEAESEVNIEYFREGKIKEVTAHLAVNDMKNIFRWQQKFPHKQSFKMSKGAWLGVKTDNLSDQLREFFETPEDLGVLVNEVVEDSPAEKAGLKAGDIIIRVADRDIRNTRDLARSIKTSLAAFDSRSIIIRLLAEKTKIRIISRGNINLNFKL